ncbi:GspE/PulE family protein [Gemmatimonadota bacterium]
MSAIKRGKEDPLREQPMQERRRKLGDILKERGLLNESQIERVIEQQRKEYKRFGEIVRDMRFVPETDLVRALADQLDVEVFDLIDYEPDETVAKKFPEDVARRVRAVPIGIIEDGEVLQVAVLDPLDIAKLDDLKRLAGMEIEPVIGTRNDIERAIERLYGLSAFFREFGELSDEESIEFVQAQDEDFDDDYNLQEMAESAEEAPVVKLVNLVIGKALRDGASDIHIEPAQNFIRIRYRIHGVLMEEEMAPPKRLQSAVATRVKILASMDIAEKRIPQDGRFHVRLHGMEVDIRVSTLPTYYGEKIVMRLLETNRDQLRLDKIGFPSVQLKEFRHLISQPNGVLLVTGPTGSGKTTTLYSALSEINSPDKNIITVEDPIEYQLEMINQVQTNPKAGLTFAASLRSILRQDPDVIMVGEIRDAETAQIAVQASLTGHLVFSTLHTNDAVGAVVRLVDMGVPPYLLANTVTGVLAQRLVRTICKHCRTEYEPDPELLEQFAEAATFDGFTFVHGKGCGECLNTGYSGRSGIYELLQITREIRDQINISADSAILTDIARGQGLKLLREDGLDKVMDGITTIEEVLRVTQDIEEVESEATETEVSQIEST